MTVPEIEAASFIAVHLTRDPIKTVHASGVGLKLAIVVDNADVIPRVPRNLSNALSLAIVITDPDGVETTYAGTFADFGSFAGDGTDGAVMLQTQDGTEIAEAGTWKAQAKVIDGNGVTYSSEQILFIVKAAAQADITYLPETVLATHQLAWWREAHTVGNPGRLGTWLDKWTAVAINAVSVAAGGGPAIISGDTDFGGKRSYLYDGNRKLEAGAVTSFVALHDGSGATLWGDFFPTSNASIQNICWTAWLNSFAGMQLVYDGPNQRLRWRIYNGEGTDLFTINAPNASAPINSRCRFAMHFKQGFGPDVAMYVNNALVATAEMPFGRSPSPANQHVVMSVGGSQGTGLALNGKIAELGFQRGAMAREVANYLASQP